MSSTKMIYLGFFVLFLAIMAEAASTPPGIAKNPARASCKKKEYKMCYNLEHVCPKFCPDSCEVECASCKPICSSTSSSEYNSPSGSSAASSSAASSAASSASSSAASSASSSASAAAAAASSGSSSASSSPSSSSSAGGSPKNSHTSTPVKYYPTPSTPSPKPSTPKPSTPSNAGYKKRVKCTNKSYGQCYNQEHVCPANCPTSCQVDCVTCKPVCNCDIPGAVCQDPRFIGGDGITFYFHGKKDKDFCLVTDPNLHINAHFIGKRNANMGRDFTWVQSIGVLFDNHRLFLGAKKTSVWDDANDRLSLAFNGEPIFLEESEGAQWTSTSTPLVTITRASKTNDITVEVQGQLKVTAKVVPITDQDSRVHHYGVTDEDRFAHLDLGFKFLSLTGKVDGVLGQTYGNGYVSRVNTRVSMPVMGGEREYASSSIFATDCLASKFVGAQDETSLPAVELASMNCASGMNGRGVVCKR